MGFTIGRTRPELIDQRRAELWDLLAEGRIHLSSAGFPFEEVTEAIDLVARRRNLGRVLLQTGGAGRG